MVRHRYSNWRFKNFCNHPSNAQNCGFGVGSVPVLPFRAVASGPAGPALAGPLFVQETYFLKIEVGQFAHTSRLRGV